MRHSSRLQFSCSNFQCSKNICSSRPYRMNPCRMCRHFLQGEVTAVKVAVVMGSGPRSH
jgi:hypothetical protein